MIKLVPGRRHKIKQDDAHRERLQVWDVGQKHSETLEQKSAVARLAKNDTSSRHDRQSFAHDTCSASRRQ